MRPDLWILDLENPQSWQKLLDCDRPAWWEQTLVSLPFFSAEIWSRGRARDWNSRKTMWLEKWWKKKIISARCKVFLKKVALVVAVFVDHDSCDENRLEDSTSVVVHERTMLIFGGHDSSQVNEFNDPMGGRMAVIWGPRNIDEFRSCLVLHKIETRNNNGTFPPSSSIFLCFTSCLFSTWLKTHFLETLPFGFRNQTRLCDQRGCTAGACGSEWCSENLQILWRWATSRGAPQKNFQLKRWSEVCVFDDLCWCFFSGIPGSIDKCWAQWKIKNPLLFFWSSPALLVKISWYNFLLSRDFRNPKE